MSVAPAGSEKVLLYFSSESTYNFIDSALSVKAHVAIDDLEPVSQAQGVNHKLAVRFTGLFTTCQSGQQGHSQPVIQVYGANHKHRQCYTIETCNNFECRIKAIA